MVGIEGINLNTENIYETPLNIGDVLSFTVTANDAEGDSLVLEAEEVGFSLADVGIDFETQRGRPLLSETLEWELPCDLPFLITLNNEGVTELPIHFIATDYRDCEPVRSDTLTVTLLLDIQPDPERAIDLRVSPLDADGSISVLAGEELRLDAVAQALGSDVSITIDALGFNGIALGLNWNKVDGFEEARGILSWTPICESLQGDTLPVTYPLSFIASSVDTCGGRIQRDTLTVPIKVLYSDGVNTIPELSTSGFSLTSLGGNEYEVSIPINTEIALDVLLSDLDGDALALSARGDGFNLQDIGIDFNGNTGIGSIISTFLWTPDCGIFGEGESGEKVITIIFRGEDTPRFCQSTPNSTEYILQLRVQLR